MRNPLFFWFSVNGRVCVPAFPFSSVSDFGHFCIKKASKTPGVLGQKDCFFQKTGQKSL